jgi:mono/diheme cytochrome c family protein
VLTAKDAMVNVLLANCGQCHGPAAPAEGSGGIQFIGNVDQLVVAGLIIPLSAETSPIVVAMEDGSMPPPSSGLPRVIDTDITVVASYIDNPRFWPGVMPPAVADAGAPPAPVPLPVVDAGVVAEPEPPVVGASDAGAEPAE